LYTIPSALITLITKWEHLCIICCKQQIHSLFASDTIQEKGCHGLPLHYAVEVHLNHSAMQREPSTRASSPPLDEGLSYQRSSEVWGKLIRNKTITTLRVTFQNMGSFSNDKEMELKCKVMCHFVTE